MASRPIERSGSYRVEWRLNGSRNGRKQSVTFAELPKAQAAKELAEARQHRMTDDEVYRAILGLTEEAPAVETPALAAWIEQWVDDKVDVASSTLKEYARLLRSRVVPELGRLRLADIDRDVLKAFNTKLAKELMPAGVRKIHAVLHQVLGTAVPKHLAENPASRLPGQRTTGLPKIKRYKACFLTADEADLVVRAADLQVRALIQTAFGTGLRLGELLGLRVRDVDLDAETPVIRVEQTFRKDGTFGAPKSERSERSVTISRTLVTLLRKRIKGKHPRDLVFAAPEGGPWQQNNLRRRHWRPAIIAAGRCQKHPPTTMIKYGRGGKLERLDPVAISDCACATRLRQRPRIHDMRHSHVGWLIDAGWDLYAIQQRIGHESIKTTFDVYGHRLPHGDTDRLDKLDVMLNARRRRAARAARRNAA